MIGGFNKLLRNFASLKGKSEFEKRLIKASYSGDMKEPKEKHMIFILECLKGKHLKLIRPKEALTKLFERFFDNLKSISLMLKALSILHRALQEEDISQMIAHKIKEKENILYPCQTEDQSYDTKMQCFICELYIDYIKNLINFIIICQLFSINIKELHYYTATLQVKELFLIFSRIDGLIENILKVFEQKAYCQNYRLLHNIVYHLFVDLLKIYQSYYLLITVMLERFDTMDIKDSKRAFIIYLNFIKINKEIRKMASSVIQEFSIKLDIVFYDVDTKLIEAMKTTIELRERERQKEEGSPFSQGNSSSHGSLDKKFLGSGSGTHKEYLTEEKKSKGQLLEIQGQGMQGIKSPFSPILKNKTEASPDSHLELPPQHSLIPKRVGSVSQVRFEDQQPKKDTDQIKSFKSEIMRGHTVVQKKKNLKDEQKENEKNLVNLDELLLSPNISPRNKNNRISEVAEKFEEEESEKFSDDDDYEGGKNKGMKFQDAKQQLQENDTNFFESSIYYDVQQDQHKKLQRAGTNNEDKFFQMNTLKLDRRQSNNQGQANTITTLHTIPHSLMNYNNMQRKFSNPRSIEDDDEDQFHSFLN